MKYRSYFAGVAAQIVAAGELQASLQPQTTAYNNHKA
jgi:hypothetical protein